MREQKRISTAQWHLALSTLLIVALMTGGCGNSKAAEKNHGHKEHGTESHDNEHGKDDRDKHDHGKDEHDEGGRSVRLSPSQLKEFDIELGTAGSGTLSMSLDLTGEVSLNPGRVAHLVPSIAGVTRQVHKQLGAPVRKGELMATLASRELAQLNASYLAAQANGSLAWIEYKREKNLYKRGVSSQREFQRARLAMSRASVSVQLARRKLYALGFTKRELQQMASKPAGRMSRFSLRAPFDGVVVAKHISQGEYLKADSQAFTVADLSTVWIVLKVHQKDLSLIRVGQAVHVTASYGRLQSTAKITYVSPIVSRSTRTSTARVVLDNAKGLWQPGLFVNGKVTVDKRGVDVLVPRTAIQRQGDKLCIFVKHDGAFTCRPVQVGRGNRRQVSILKGLEAGDRYVSKGGFTLKAQLSKASFGDGHSH